MPREAVRLDNHPVDFGAVRAGARLRRTHCTANSPGQTRHPRPPVGQIPAFRKSPTGWPRPSTIRQTPPPSRQMPSAGRLHQRTGGRADQGRAHSQPGHCHAAWLSRRRRHGGNEKEEFTNCSPWTLSRAGVERGSHHPAFCSDGTGLWIANLELLPLRLNESKNARIGQRQKVLAKKLHEAGLLSKMGWNVVQAK